MELFGFPWSFSSIVDMWSHKYSSCNSTRKRCNLLLKSRCKLYDIAVLFGETPIKDGWNENICVALQLAYLVTSSHKHWTCNIGFHWPSSSWPSSQSSRIHATTSQRITLNRINLKTIYQRCFNFIHIGRHASKCTSEVFKTTSLNRALFVPTTTPWSSLSL